MPTPTIHSRLILRFCLLLLVSVLAGCSGCQDPDDEKKLTKEELAKKRERERDALVVGESVSLPKDKDRKLITVKPGHWHETTQSFKSNREDLQVVLVSEALYGTDKANLPSTNFVNEYSRRSTLPKGQEKNIGLQVYIPPTTKRKQDLTFDPNLGVAPPTALRLKSELRAVPLMNPIPNSEQRLVANELKPYTFQLAILSPKNLDYQFLANLDVVRWGLADNDFDTQRIISYDVALVSPKDNQYPFPSSMLTMTSMAAIFWDDVSVDDLSVDQQNAIIDWVHWGGQLVINGPTSWSRLQGSALSPYMPATSASSFELKSSDFAELAKTWETVNISRSGLSIPIELPDTAAGLKFQLSDRGAWLPGSGELIAESSVGRGRIIVSGFSLRDPALVRWSYYSSFISTGLLRRPPREIRRIREEVTSQRQVWSTPFTNFETLPQLHSNFRVLSRDLPATLNSENTVSIPTASSRSLTPEGASVEAPEPQMLALSQKAQESYEPAAWGGAGSWTDYSGVAIEAITSLRAAAGIELPERSTIIKLLGGYLICLVPLNWLVFKLARRLEYAWLAAPIMAIVGVVVVGKVARLDIGFARRTTEIAVLETYGDYPRAHLTQYVALYTSLSTNYSVEFPETDSVALPMGDVQREMRRAQMSTRQLQTSYGRSDGVLLEPLTVYSNSTEMLHAEQMIKLDAPYRLITASDGQQTVINGSSFPVKGAVLVRRGSVGDLETAWIDTLEPGEKRLIKWAVTDTSHLFEDWSNSPNTQRTPPSDEQLSTMDGIWIGGLLHKIGLKTPLVAGQVRLIGYTDKSLGGLKINPSQDQYDNICVVVAHLSPPTRPSIMPDKNIAGRELQSDPKVVPPSEPEVEIE